MVVSSWGQYLTGRHFIVITDQKALKFLLEQKLHTGSQLKWIIKLMQFDFTIEYKKGKQKKVVHALSRIPAVELASLTLGVVRSDLLQTIMSSWDSDTELRKLIHKLSILKEDIKGFSFINQQLRWKVHGGHSGIDHTYRRITSFFYWKGLRRDVEDYIKGCEICQKCKYDKATYLGLFQPLAIPSLAWASVRMDIIEGLPKSKGKEVIWVVVDRLTKYVHFVALSHPYTALDIANLFMEHVFKLHGLPEDIVSDKDPIFTSKVWRELFAMQGVTLKTSTTDRQTN
ncbi:hypothetical protein KY289_018830 [Solanum tuberosum]|nr:hypothetical protein KY289_018830 [Solanum tuberosum]